MHDSPDHRCQGSFWVCRRLQPPCPGHGSPDHQCGFGDAWTCRARNCPTHSQSMDRCPAGPWYCKRKQPPCPGHSSCYHSCLDVKVSLPGLPLPAKTEPPTPVNVRTLQAGLTSVIAGHPGSVHPWTFYEELDKYLGPWGNSGYPISYGKYYCMAFNSNDKLRYNPQTNEWVRRTTITLQEPLRDFVVDHFRAGTLASLTEPELRKFAFSRHPIAYTRGGLTTVVATAPEMLPIVVLIPLAEFNPTSDNFSSTVMQVINTMNIVFPEAGGVGVAVLAGPAHTGLFPRAAQMDAAQFQRDQIVNRWLSDTLRIICGGQMDSLPLLDSVTDRLNATQFGNQGAAGLARQVVQAADERKHVTARYYRAQILLKPSLLLSIDHSAPGWSRW
jgi:hypothetical protein